MAHLLIIDDEADIRLLVMMLLESAGHTVAAAGNGTDGLAYLAAHGADCVLLDINMPAMTSWEVCRRIKTDPMTAHIPVIIQTVRGAQQESAELESAKPDGFLSKPFGKSELISAIDNVLAKAGNRVTAISPARH
jgi:CheY-like chemotaxis protein